MAVHPPTHPTPPHPPPPQVVMQQSRVARAALASRQRTVRALSCFDEAVMLCDVGADAWPQLYVNDQWCRLTGG